MRSGASHHQQNGAIIVTVALTLLFLLGFMGIALDFGRLFIVKTELQTAVDSCALAAANELDSQNNALTRATSAGMTAGNLNNVNLQSPNWSGQGKIISSDITFRDSAYGVTTVAANAKYAQCQHTQAGTKMWLLHALGAFTGNPAAYPGTQSVAALAVATRASAQTSCMLPIGLCEKASGVPYAPGEWVQGAVGSRDAVSGQFRWLDFSGNPGGANDVKALLQGPGQCSLPGENSVVRESGNIGSAAFAYNTRFGIYQGGGSNNAPPTGGIPDLSGYAWYSDRSLVQPSPDPYPNRYPILESKRTAFTPYQGDNTAPDTSGLRVVGNSNTGSHATYGANRRIVAAPIVSCPIPSSASTPVRIKSVACIFLLHPIKAGAGSNSEKMWVEYVGAANDPSSPCSTIGLSGGTGGPLVPVLVR